MILKLFVIKCSTENAEITQSCTKFLFNSVNLRATSVLSMK